MIYGICLGNDQPRFSFGFDSLDSLTLSKGGQCRATLTLSGDRLFNNKPAATVSYDFVTGKLGYFNLELKNPGLIKDIGKISFNIYEDKSLNLLIIYCIDAEGEVFKEKRGTLKNSGWYLVTTDIANLKHDKASGNKSGNGQLDYPLKNIGLQIMNFSLWGQSVVKGRISFADLQLFPDSRMEIKELMELKKADNNKLITASKNEKIVIDGEIGEWEKTPSLQLNSGTAQVLEGDGRQCNANIYVAYDKDFLYLAAQVIDATPWGRYKDQDIWKNDGLEIWFDLNCDSLLSMNQPDDFQLGLSFTTGSGTPGVWIWQNDKSAFLQASIKTSSRKTADGYIIETALPLAALPGLKLPVDGKIIAANLSLTNAGDKTFNRLLWSGTRLSYPANFGFLSFGPVKQEEMNKVVTKRKTACNILAVGSGIKEQYHGPPVIANVMAEETAERYKKYEITVEVAAEYTNPYDFDDFHLYGEFVTPSGKRQLVDGFYRENFRIHISNKGDQLFPHGKPEWKIRFTPKEIGTYSFHVAGVDRKGRRNEFPVKTFRVTESDSNGSIRVSSTDPNYLQFDSGRKFYGIGYAAHFWGDTHILTFLKHYITQLAFFGANYTSINLENIQDCGFKLETARLGWYNQENSCKLDYIIEIAENRGVFLLPCLNQTAMGLAANWKSNKYNRANGGPCESPSAYFTDHESYRLIANRIRYTIARWGYSNAILGWEIFNEVNYTEAYKESPQAVRNFHEKVAAMIRKYDVGGHLITTSFGSSDQCEDPQIWQMKDIDFTITHCYSRDMAQSIYERQTTKLAYRKPTIGGEAGLPANDCAVADIRDPKGISFHNIIWSSAMSNCAGNILQWWNFQHIEPLDLGRLFRPFVQFEYDIDWPKQQFQRQLLTPRHSSGSQRTKDFEVPVEIQWRKPDKTGYTIKNTGVWGRLDLAKLQVNYIADADPNVKLKALPGIVFGKDSVEWSGPLVLQLTVPDATVMVLRFQAVAKVGATPVIKVNGQTIQKMSLVDRDAQDNPYGQELSDSIEIPLRRNYNTIEIGNDGKGWFSLHGLTVKNFADSGVADNIRCFALLGKTMALLWLQDSFSTWYQYSLGVKPTLQTNINVTIPVDFSGEAVVEWWDTWTGKIVTSSTVKVHNKILVVTPPPFIRDIAAKIKYPASKEK